ncbi:hypothetical protein HXX76_006594 [Chlamydomonas incerta]|uniref:Uncharacterized protein n=1 Tax=Chlamydomonas incerta TaxID=51695 RepID=A0A835SZX8_CHLIN|nr:hypothetical protein HXX76_006594 [Chlamydomonas incerta]|eukprot:KAG2436283.1 hypothetical protein HXX76_006594 [Chlamydomonas incerta]
MTMRVVFATLGPLLIMLLLVQRTFPIVTSRLGSPTAARGLHSSEFAPAAARRVRITDVVVIHSYWSERKDLGPGICNWLAEVGGPLADVPCSLFPGFWAAAAPRSAIIDLIQQRVVAPESHARPLGWYTKLLYGLGISSRAEPLLDEAEHMADPALLGIAASHVLAVSNWTFSMVRRGVPPGERADRHLLLIEDDAVMTEDGMAALERALDVLDPSYDMVGLDSKDNFCSLQRWQDALASWFWPASWRTSPHLVRAKLAFSRTTGLLFSYKGAVRLLSNAPVTREVDLWYRDLATEGLFDVFVTCPTVIGSSDLPSVKRRR